MSQAGVIDVEAANPQIPTSFITDDGTAVPIGNQLEILGINGIVTSGSGDTVTIEFDGSDAFTITGNSGGAISPVLGNWDTLGDGSIEIVGSVGTLTTQLTGLTNNAILYGQGTSTIGKLGPLTNGQIVIGSTGVAPVAGTITSPDGSITVTLGAGTIALKSDLGTGRFPISPYVVGPIGEAGYQTIQSALDAANTAGGGAVFVQPGTYTEDLTLYDNTQVIGALGLADIGDLKIIGTHTPPASGGFVFRNVYLQSATDVFSSAVAGSAHLIIADAAIVVTNGYTFNLLNWTGKLECWDVNDRGSTNDGFISNTGGAEVAIFSCAVGAGSGNTMTLSGTTSIFTSDVGCPIDFVTGSIASLEGNVCTNTLTFSNDSTGEIIFSEIDAQVTMSSSAAWLISDTTINTSSNPAIAGAGAGTLTLGGLTFVDGRNLAGTLTLAGASGFLPTVMTDGQLLIGDSSSAAVAGSLTSTGGTITVTAGAGTLNIDTVGSAGIVWTDVTGATQTIAVQNGYLTDRGAGVTYTLPATASIGDVFKIVGKLGLTTITPNANQQLLMGSTSGTVGVTGTAVGTNVGDSVTFRCITSGASTVWRAESFVGVWNLT